MYTTSQRLLYNIKRHLISIFLVFVGCVFLFIYKDISFILDIVHIVIVKLFSIGFEVSITLLLWKYAFPKITLQEKINENPIAISIFAGLLFIAIALMF